MVSGLVQGSANLGITEQFSIPVVVLTGNNLRQAGCLCHILGAGLRITNKEIVVLIRIRLDQAEIGVYLKIFWY